MKFDVYADPGHAWCKVPLQLINKLGIAEEITSCSYVRGDKVYLEEDCDLATFVQAMNERGVDVEFRIHHTDRSSKIRGYAIYDGA